MQANTKHAAITFSAKDYESVTCLIDSPGITVNSESYGGWDPVQRPQNVALLTWTGYEPMSMTIPILFDEWQTQKSVENDILALELLAGRGPGAGGRTQPPDVTLKASAGFGALIPHNFNGESLDWVITSLEWSTDEGDVIRRRPQPDGSGGHRVRQAGTVVVTQHVEDKRLIELSVARRRNAHGRRRTVHVVKKGETLMSIARKEYGTADRWQDIAIHNGINDPRHLRPGKRLKLPK